MLQQHKVWKEILLREHLLDKCKIFNYNRYTIMKIIELLIDEEAMLSGIEAISIVDKPAIEENFIALKK